VSVLVASNLPPACIRFMPRTPRFVADWFRKLHFPFHMRGMNFRFRSERIVHHAIAAYLAIVRDASRGSFGEFMETDSKHKRALSEI
jgi:hypothetical protein